MRSIIVTETKALARRQIIVDSLKGRLDIRAPDDVKPALDHALPRLLVAGLDYDAEPGTGGWPLPTGGRYPKLCFSPLVEKSVAAGLVLHDVHRLPTTETAYEDYIANVTGIPSEFAPELYRLYRVTPGELFHACKAMQAECPQAWRLLLSNEYKLAAQAWPMLRRHAVGSAFKHPLVHGFMMFGEFERAALIMRHLERADAIFDRNKLLDALNSGQPLSQAFDSSEIVEVYRWLEYLSLSTPALKDLLFDSPEEESKKATRGRSQSTPMPLNDEKAPASLDRSVNDILAMPRGYAPWALARGELPEDIDVVANDAGMRRILVNILSCDEQGKVMPGCKALLDNDWVARFYGMTNQVLPILAIDGARDRFPTRRAPPYAGRFGKPQHMGDKLDVAKSGALWAMAPLAGAMRASWAPGRQTAISAAAETYVATRNANAPDKREKREVSHEKNLKVGLKSALLYLPTSGRPGSVARFDPLGWEDPYADQALWGMCSGSARDVLGSIPYRERILVGLTLRMIRRVYAPLYARTNDTKLTERLACHLATTISPISANPQIAFAIAKLKLSPKTQKRLGVRQERAGFNKIVPPKKGETI